MSRGICQNQLGLYYTCKDAVEDLEEAIKKGQQPLDKRNLETRQTRKLQRWW